MTIRRTLQAAAIVVASLSLPLSRAQAQLSLGFGGGATWPLSGLSDLYKTGYNVLGTLELGLPAWPVNVRVDGMFNQAASGSGVVGAGTLQMWTLNANAVYNVVTQKTVTPYVIGGAGYYNNAYHVAVSGSTVVAGGNIRANSFGLNGGLGFKVGVASLSIFLESRFHYIFVSSGNLEFIPLTAGVYF
jgi:hypothetical protein